MSVGKLQIPVPLTFYRPMLYSMGRYCHRVVSVCLSVTLIDSGHIR